MSEAKGGAAIAASLVAVVGGVLALLLLGGGGSTESDSQAQSCTAVAIDAAGLPVEVAGLDAAQTRIAATVINVAAERQLPIQAARIAIMAGLVESNLRNLANAGDFQRPATSRVMTADEWTHWRSVAMLSMNYPNDGIAAGDWDSVGFLQGSPEAGWGGAGTPDEMVQNLLNPTYVAGRFFDSLTAIEGWELMEPGQAAQRVQRSAYPDRYQDRKDEADAILEALSSTQLNVDPSCDPGDPPLLAEVTVSGDGWIHPVAAGSPLSSRFGVPRGGYTHMGDDFPAPAGTPILAAADGVVVHVSCSSWKGRSPCNLQIDHGVDPATGLRVTSLSVHMYPGNIFVSVGDQVAAGQRVANVGSYGNSTGPHLHFEVWQGNTPVSPVAWLRSHGVDA